MTKIEIKQRYEIRRVWNIIGCSGAAQETDRYLLFIAPPLYDAAPLNENCFRASRIRAARYQDRSRLSKGGQFQTSSHLVAPEECGFSLQTCGGLLQVSSIQFDTEADSARSPRDHGSGAGASYSANSSATDFILGLAAQVM